MTNTEIWIGADHVFALERALTVERESMNPWQGVAMTDVSNQDLRAAVAIAITAPSRHDPEPWRWRIEDGTLTIRIEPKLGLVATDPLARDVLLSCGAALRLAQLALRAQGWRIRTTYTYVDQEQLSREPAVLAGEALAVIVTDAKDSVDHHAVALVRAAQRRVSDRRLLDARGVTDDVREQLREAASQPEAFVNIVQTAELSDPAMLTNQDDARAAIDEKQRDELLRWVRADSSTPEGVPRAARPHVRNGDGPAPVPLREVSDQEARGFAVPAESDEHPMFALVVAQGAGVIESVRAGETMMQLILEAAARGLSSCPVNEPVDHPVDHLALRSAFVGVGTPHIVLRIGVPITPGELVPTPRPSTAVIDED